MLCSQSSSHRTVIASVRPYFSSVVSPKCLNFLAPKLLAEEQNGKIVILRQMIFSVFSLKPVKGFIRWQISSHWHQRNVYFMCSKVHSHFKLTPRFLVRVLKFRQGHGKWVAGRPCGGLQGQSRVPGIRWRRFHLPGWTGEQHASTCYDSLSWAIPQWYIS